jgi:hypothetical protein
MLDGEGAARGRRHADGDDRPNRMGVDSVTLDETVAEPGAPRPRPYLRLLKALRVSAWTVAHLLVLAAIATMLFLHRGDPEGSARIANREIDYLLQPGERVDERVPVMERRWWNYFRVTNGVLAATNRRLLFVGVPPEELFPHEDEPPELEEQSWMYETGVVAVRQRVFFNTRAGLVVGAGDSRRVLAIASADRVRLGAVLAAMDRRLQALGAAREAERLAAGLAAAAARQPVYHVVQRGESLELIAQRYGTSADSLRAWNGLTGSRIRLGVRLLVKPGS